MKEEEKNSIWQELNPQLLELQLLRQVLYHCATTTDLLFKNSKPAQTVTMCGPIQSSEAILKG